MFVFILFGCTAKISDITIKSGSVDTIVVKDNKIYGKQQSKIPRKDGRKEERERKAPSPPPP